MHNLLEKFGDYFEFVPADNEQLLETCRHLRYQVFCEEQHILQSSSSEIEQDIYDQRSVHTLLRHKESGNYAALVRLVLPDTEQPEYAYPVEEHISILKQEEKSVFEQIPRPCAAEISRFSVSKTFRRRPGENHTNHGINDQFGKPQPPGSHRVDSFITLGLFKAIVRMSTENNITHWLAFMEPSLIRLLGRVGIRFTSVGPLINYCGQRHACVQNAHDVLEGIKEVRPDIWQFITDRGRYQLTT